MHFMALTVLSGHFVWHLDCDGSDPPSSCGFIAVVFRILPPLFCSDHCNLPGPTKTESSGLIALQTVVARTAQTFYTTVLFYLTYGDSGARCRLAYNPADVTATHCLLLQ